MNLSSHPLAPSLSRRALLTASGWLASAGALLGLGGMPARTASARAQGSQLEGSWAVTINQPFPTFLVTFISDGTMVGSNVARGTAYHGVWRRTGEREFAYTQWQFRFDQSGAHIGAEKVRGQLTLQENLSEYTAQTVTEVYDVDGNLVRTGSFTPRGQRLTVEPLA